MLLLLKKTKAAAPDRRPRAPRPIARLRRPACLGDRSHRRSEARQQDNKRPPPHARVPPSVLVRIGVAIRPQTQKERPEVRAAKRAGRQHSVISRGQAISCGMTPAGIRHMLETGRWERVHPNVYASAGVEWSWKRSLMAACLWATDALASHRAAGALWNLDGCDKQNVEILAVRCSSPSPRGVIVHRTRRLHSPDISSREGIPVTSVHRTLIDLGAVATMS